jgi:hypothetical protein
MRLSQHTCKLPNLAVVGQLNLLVIRPLSENPVYQELSGLDAQGEYAVIHLESPGCD